MSLEQIVAEGTVEGTGSAINLNLGFVPRVFMAWNIDGEPTELIWINTMGAAKGFKKVDAGTTNAAMSYISSNGITASTSTSTFIGVTIGADSDINVSAETIMYLAIR